MQPFSLLVFMLGRDKDYIDEDVYESIEEDALLPCEGFGAAADEECVVSIRSQRKSCLQNTS